MSDSIVKTEFITCPECGEVQSANVTKGNPYNIYIHHCRKCGYIIMESEWEPAYAYRYERDINPDNFFKYELMLKKCKIIRETEKSYIINATPCNKKNKKFIRKEAFSSFAHIEQDKALDHYIRRTKFRIDRLHDSIRSCRSGLEEAKKIQNETN